MLSCLLILMLSDSWLKQASPTDASLRGLAAVSSSVVWASGTKGTWLRTSDGGAHWQSGIVPGASDLDFRDVEGWSASHALLLSSGEGSKSRVYRTSDGGAHWTCVFTNPDAKGFFDAFSFWDDRHGILLGDPVAGQFVVFSTGDGGQTWKRQTTPRALAGEGAFAASGTALAVQGKNDAWFGTGGAARSRVFHTTDGGSTWKVVDTPVLAKKPSAGIFSLAFTDRLHGVAVGGDYGAPNLAAAALALTRDGGLSWRASAGKSLSGYRSGAAFAPGRRNLVLTVGVNGSELSHDGGASWEALGGKDLNAVAVTSDGTAWAVGSHGGIWKLAPVVKR